ncbi:MAG TPA: alpha-amylase family glycosyl hydrolase [Kiritimatiellia bacterium]|nr:alpha-amylase family glycosyl hydrolase [Kiritimatiellia bacterium]HRZ13173.1 alpha-amylase family glycosyl hydrolase [Kiritimatiellia bacterium]HSA17594.1 alpha-amylase family glycosyl hydrolase [Kiritimatiellia bacterium]
MSTRSIRAATVAFSLLLLASLSAPAEVALQYFNNTWNEIADKLPELAEAGYGALWLPPPQKGSGGLSVGYDLWDPFDLGGIDQRGTVKTRYGTEAELLRLIELAHRFGMRVYFDNIMNHRAFDVPGWDEYTALDIYPGMAPEDFHLRVTEDGFYRKWDNTVNWGSTWEVQNRNLSDLIDIAHEDPNANFGASEGSTYPKIHFVRQPTHPEWYDWAYTPTGMAYVGFYSTNITTNMIAQYPGSFTEDVGGYLCRNVRWLIHHTKVDGLRLDAVKHVPGYFFGEQWAGDKDSSSAGYCGQAQWQFNMTRGYADWDNHRDTVFDLEKSFGRNDALMFGEHMGEPPPYGDYWAAGMRLLDARTHQTFNDNLGNPWGSLSGLDSADYISGKQMGQYLGVYYAKSHDDNVAYREELHNAFNLTRAGLPVIYTDGNRHAEIMGASGGAFPRHANTCYLGQWGDSRIPNLAYIHSHFARSWHMSKWGDGDFCAYERMDKRENGSMNDPDGTVLLMMINDNYASGQSRSISTGFGHTPFVDDAYLYNYSTYGGGFYTYASQLGSVIVPPGGYFAFSWRSPEQAQPWSCHGGSPVTIFQNGQEAGTISVTRRDGPDGDPGFNPYGAADANSTDYSYTWSLPRVTSSTNLRFVSFVDGSAANVLMKLDGGMNLNTNNHSSGDPRDHPPGNEGSTDVFEGYEQALFIHRQHREKFADTNSAHNTIGSMGSGSYTMTIGTAGLYANAGSGNNDWDGAETAAWVYHNPNDNDEWSAKQFFPLPQNAVNSNITVRVKVGYSSTYVNRLALYYTTDGATWPEGAGGFGRGTTKVVPLTWYANGAPDGTGTPDWWSATIPAMTNGTVLRYKVGAYREQGSDGFPWDVESPVDGASVSMKTTRMGVWQVTNINLRTVAYRPHNDWGTVSTGLVDGFHVMRSRAFLDRGGKASIFNTFTQPFYLDMDRPGGEVKYPAESETLGSKEYGAVVRTDPTVTEVWFNISDSDKTNDDGSTGQTNGIGTNAVGQLSWARAYKVTPSLYISSAYPDEWRFTYRNIPSGNSNATITVKLRELSSSTNLTLSDTLGHFTTLTRNVKTDAPAYDLYVAWPQYDGDLVFSGYVAKVWFSQSLADGIDNDTLKSRFIFKINDVAQGRDDWYFEWDVSGSHHALAIPLSDMYNGDTNYLHNLQVLHTNAAGLGITLQASRIVRAQSSADSILIQITDPPEYDSDGAPYEIVLPDVASPSPTQRQYRVQVETDTKARNVWIEFTNSVGFAPRIASTSNQLTGTVSVWAGSNTVAGSGTLFHQELGVGNTIRISTNYLVVSQVVASNQLILTATYPGATASGQTAWRVDPNPSVSGNKQIWGFLWTNMTAGHFQFYAHADTNSASGTTKHASALRNATVVLMQSVNSNTNDLDDDDDGLQDDPEVTSTNLPDTNPETWNNGQVHIWYVYGRTDPLSPDTDNDGLPDGLESGWGGPSSGTDTNTDTNGDGWKNFIADQDIPIYNTTDNSGYSRYNFNRSRTDQICGTTTDPSKPDTDYDGLLDGQEDLNRNGRVEIGTLNGSGVATGVLAHPNVPTVYNSSQVDSDSLAANARFLEPDPNNGDTDGDDLADGAEDADLNERVNLALLWPAGTTTTFVVTWTNNSTNILGNGLSGVRSRALDYSKLWTDHPRPRYTNGVWQNTNVWPRLLVLETDPLDRDTEDDGLPDGWEQRYGLDPFNDGWYSIQTGQMSPTNTRQGADGDLTSCGVSNYQHYLGGTDPRVCVTSPPPPEGSIVIGRGEALGVINGTTNYQEFTEWTWSDLRALDYYEGGGNNNQQGDIYKAWDDWDTSRDLLAFYARDGGSSDGKLYFRFDFYDLKALAEQGNLDLYVVIDTGNQSIGERKLPDDVDTLTEMRWEAVVALYDASAGTVYVDTNPGQNTSTFAEDLFTYGGVQAQPQHFGSAYYNHELDAVEFSISRTALTAIGWNGSMASLNFQVYSTRDGTQNDPVGAGDLGGRSDIRDAIWNDYIAEDYWEAQAGLSGANSVLYNWIPGTVRAGRAKAAIVLHGNQHDQPGHVAQLLVNTGAGAGYHRPLLAHEVFGQALNLHVTPTLAASLQWARVDTNASPTWRDGPTLNETVRRLVATNVVWMLGSTFSDHILPYFTKEFNRDNIRLASEYLSEIYGASFTTNSVFWTPERVLDDDTLAKITNAGFRATVLDQNTHLYYWFGRTDSMGDNGYSINRIGNVDCFVINNLPTEYRFSNTDNGLSLSMRALFNRRARGDQQRVTTIFSNWEDFSDNDDADAYDRNLRWIANRPWIKLVGLEEVLSGAIDTDGDDVGNAWWKNDRGSPSLSKQSHDWINHATRGDYDNWYVGEATKREGLQNKVFEIRPGTNVSQAYGMLYFGGAVSSAWRQVESIADTNIARLARAVIHASVFETAFHNEDNNDLRRWSTGEYLYPSESYLTLIDFAKTAQAQTRLAALYEEVDDWAAIASGVTTPQAAQADVDLDGENEYVLYNDRLYAIFERIGGRMTAAFARDPSDGAVRQVLGNPVSYAGVETEVEGTGHVATNGTTLSYRTSGLKDWWAGTTNYVNDLYTFTYWTNGWRMTSADGKIRKIITLNQGTNLFQVSYNVTNTLNGGVLYVRHGFSPNLDNLLRQGQNTLGVEEHSGGVMTLANLGGGKTVQARLGYGDAGHNAAFNLQAVDDMPGTNAVFTITMRNQAQTHQVEVFGTNAFAFSMGFSVLGTGDTDSDGDGIPDQWELDNFGNLTTADEDSDWDDDTLLDWQEQVADTDPKDKDNFFEIASTARNSSGFIVRFGTANGRKYYIYYNNTGLLNQSWSNATPTGIDGTGALYEWTDNGTQTSPHPNLMTNRFYKISVAEP